MNAETMRSCDSCRGFAMCRASEFTAGTGAELATVTTAALCANKHREQWEVRGRDWSATVSCA